jgi:hypothetical protein
MDYTWETQAELETVPERGRPGQCKAKARLSRQTDIAALADTLFEAS